MHKKDRKLFDTDSDEENNQEYVPISVVSHLDVVYHQNKWVKVECAGVTKDIYDPPANDINDFMEKMRTFFNELDEQLTKHKRAIKNNKNLLLKYVNLAYIDTDDTQYEIWDNSKLEKLIKQGEENFNERILTLIIRINSDEPVEEGVELPEKNENEYDYGYFPVEQKHPHNKPGLLFANDQGDDDETDYKPQNLFGNDEGEKESEKRNGNQFDAIQPENIGFEEKYMPKQNEPKKKANLFDYDIDEDEEEKGNKYEFKPIQPIYQDKIPIEESAFEDKKGDDDDMAFGHGHSDSDEDPLEKLDKLDKLEPSRSKEEMDQIRAALMNRQSLMPEELEQQAQILEELERNKSKKQEMDDEDMARKLQNEINLDGNFQYIGAHQYIPSNQGANYTATGNNGTRSTNGGGAATIEPPRNMQMEFLTLNASATLERIKVEDNKTREKSKTVVVKDKNKIKEEKKKDPGSNEKKSGIFSKMMNALKIEGKKDLKEISITDRNLMAVATNGNEQYAPPNGNHHVFFTWIIKNESKYKWDKPNYLVDYDSSDATFKKIFIKERINPGQLGKLVVAVKLPASVRAQNIDRIVLQFRFESTKKICFGETLVGVIQFDTIPQIFDDEVQQIHKNPKQASKGVKAETQGDYYEIAGMLSDRGMGDFETCLNVLTACNGDVQEAKQMLQSQHVYDLVNKGRL